MPASVALSRHALPDSESRLTIIRTLTPSLIMLVAERAERSTLPSAFWMSDSMPAASNAASRLGRSLASQRGEVVGVGQDHADVVRALAAVAAVTAVGGRGVVAAARRGGEGHERHHATRRRGA